MLAISILHTAPSALNDKIIIDSTNNNYPLCFPASTTLLVELIVHCEFNQSLQNNSLLIGAHGHQAPSHRSSRASIASVSNYKSQQIEDCKSAA